MAEAHTFTAQDPIRVFLLDDHEVVRRGLSDLLDAEEDISVVGDAENVEHALVRAPAVRPHVAVLDVRLPDGNGITVCRELRDQMPELAVLMLTSFDDEDALLDAIMAGASGYVLKQIKGTDLVSAVRTVASGQSMLDPATTARLMRSLRAEPAQVPEISPELASLSPRERDPRADRGRTHQPRDRQEPLPVGEDRQEPHLPAARQAGRPAPGAGRGPRLAPGAVRVRRPFRRLSRAPGRPARPEAVRPLPPALPAGPRWAGTANSPAALRARGGEETPCPARFSTSRPWRR